MSSIREIQKRLKNLDWSDVRDWAGSKIMARGETYFENGHVSNLRISKTGIIAKVHGSRPYLTHVFIDKNGKLNSECTCPYTFDCKHGVATLLAYSYAVKSRVKIPTIKEDDPDIARKLLGDDFEDGDECTEAEPLELKSQHLGRRSADADLSALLAKKTKAALKELVMSYAEKYPEIRKELIDDANLSTGKIRSLVSAMRKEIVEITSNPSWQSHWSGQGEVADFDRVKSVMEQLLSQGHYQAVIDIKKELIAQANPYIEICDDDGYAGLQISDCIEIGFEALSKSDLPDIEKLYYAIMTGLEDEYNLFSGYLVVVDSIKEKKVWSQVADKLYKKIPKRAGGRTGFRREYERDSLTDALIAALERADRSDEVLALCKNEANITGSWERYVSRLYDHRMYSDAKSAALEGLSKVDKKYTGVTKALREWVIKIAKKESDFQTILKVCMEDFLEEPSLSTYNEALKVAQKVKSREKVKKWSLQYLESGVIDKAPVVELNSSFKPARYIRFPLVDILIDIAAHDKDSDQVLHWYNASKTTHPNHSVRASSLDHQVASAISDKYPEESIKIWKSLAERKIALTNPSAYESAVYYLSRIKNLSASLGKTPEWDLYLAHIVDRNKRKTRFLKSLKGLRAGKLI